MTTPQIITLIILAIFMLIGIFGSFYSENINYRAAFSALSLMIIGLIFVILIMQADAVNKLRKQQKSKCPEYERVEDVYRLKD